MSLGRFQAGQFLTLAVNTTDAGHVPALPDSAPVMTITDSGSAVIATAKVPLDPLLPFTFGMRIFLGLEFALGTYTVGYAWTVNGSGVSVSDTFDLIAGGDAGGRIIAMYGYDRPEAKYVVTQLTSGNVVQGRNPRL